MAPFLTDLLGCVSEIFFEDLFEIFNLKYEFFGLGIV